MGAPCQHVRAFLKTSLGVASVIFHGEAQPFRRRCLSWLFFRWHGQDSSLTPGVLWSRRPAPTVLQFLVDRQERVSEGRQNGPSLSSLSCCFWDVVVQNCKSSECARK